MNIYSYIVNYALNWMYKTYTAWKALAHHIRQMDIMKSLFGVVNVYVHMVYTYNMLSSMYIHCTDTWNPRDVGFD